MISKIQKTLRKWKKLNIDNHNVFKLTDVSVAVKEADVIAILVAHKEFKGLNKLDNKVILDFSGALKK